MANSVRITYRGELLCCLDQTEVEAVEPFREPKAKPQNLWKRICGFAVRFYTGKRTNQDTSDFEERTRILFKDGTSIVVKMPFMEFVNGYC